jgi:hypothetical protein
MRRFVLILPLAAVAFGQLPLKPKSVRFAVIGDNGTGERPQYDLARQMAKSREAFPFEFVLMLGDNIYGSKGAAAFKRKFEDPYKSLLDAGVKFYASLGNHDDASERQYKPFNMGGKSYYKFNYGNVDFFALDSNYMNPEQLNWISRELEGSRATWKICFFHHPLYSNARRHSSDLDLRARLEPILRRTGTNVVLSGHDHVYERIKPQNGIYFWVVGSSGKLRYGDLRRSTITEKGFDTDLAFMMVEIAEEEFHFLTVSRSGEKVDSGLLRKLQPGQAETQGAAAAGSRK